MRELSTNKQGSDHMTDKELNDVLIQVSQGDTSAFEQLYNELSVPVFTVALRILKNRALAEDSVQEVFMKLYLTGEPCSQQRHCYYVECSSAPFIVDCGYQRSYG